MHIRHARFVVPIARVANFVERLITPLVVIGGRDWIGSCTRMMEYNHLLAAIFVDRIVKSFLDECAECPRVGNTFGFQFFHFVNWSDRPDMQFRHARLFPFINTMNPCKPRSSTPRSIRAPWILFPLGPFNSNFDSNPNRTPKRMI